MGIGTRCQLTWPTENEWYADAAFVVVAFEAFKGCVGANLNVARTTIVAGEYDQCVVQLVGLAQCGNHGTNAVV